MPPTFLAASLAHLPAAAVWLLGHLRATAGRRVVLLHGEMGAGKTTLVRAVAAALGVTDNVSSPTYGLVHEYRTAAGAAGAAGSQAPYQMIYHFDLYRLRSAQEALALGIFDYLDAPGALSFIEWPERLAELLPDVAADALTLTLRVDPATDSRTLTIALTS